MLKLSQSKERVLLQVTVFPTHISIGAFEDVTIANYYASLSAQRQDFCSSRGAGHGNAVSSQG
jgi:hypothetical protein